MNIALYAPLKPPGTGAPSGDVATASELLRFLRARGHTVEQVSRLRARHFFQDKPLLRRISEERRNALTLAQDMRAETWLTFHSYWKAPDLLGPWCCRHLGIPYVMHKGMHALKRRRSRASLPGFLVNRKALLQADAVFTDDANDLPGLGFLPGHKVGLLAPGIDPTQFYPDPEAGSALRLRLGLGECKLVATVAMLRPGMKTQNVKMLLEGLKPLSSVQDFHLLIAGDGPSRQELETLARKRLPGRCRFLGQMEKNALRALYSAADLFVLPGIGESLGMVYLESMCCETPVVAYAGSGPSQLIRNNETGILVASPDTPGTTESIDTIEFRHAVGRLLQDDALRVRLGRNARPHVLANHTLSVNLAPLEAAIARLVEQGRGQGIG